MRLVDVCECYGGECPGRKRAMLARIFVLFPANGTGSAVNRQCLVVNGPFFRRLLGVMLMNWRSGLHLPTKRSIRAGPGH